MNKEKGKIYQFDGNLPTEKNVHNTKMILSKLGKRERTMFIIVRVVLEYSYKKILNITQHSLGMEINRD